MKSRLFGFVVALGIGLGTRAQEGQPQSLKKADFKVCGVPLKLEIAKTESERFTGMMFRDGVAEGTGMVFVFSKERPLSFWMRNVPFDLDIGYFDRKGKLINALTMKGTSPLIKAESLPTYASLRAAKYAVEVKAGFYAARPKSGCMLSPLSAL